MTVDTSLTKSVRDKQEDVLPREAITEDAEKRKKNRDGNAELIMDILIR